jgi:hypothetical protein
MAAAIFAATAKKFPPPSLDRWVSEARPIDPRTAATLFGGRWPPPQLLRFAFCWAKILGVRRAGLTTLRIPPHWRRAFDLAINARCPKEAFADYNTYGFQNIKPAETCVV